MRNNQYLAELDSCLAELRSLSGAVLEDSASASRLDQALDKVYNLILDEFEPPLIDKEYEVFRILRSLRTPGLEYWRGVGDGVLAIFRTLRHASGAAPVLSGGPTDEVRKVPASEATKINAAPPAAELQAVKPLAVSIPVSASATAPDAALNAAPVAPPTGPVFQASRSAAAEENGGLNSEF